MSQPFFFEMEWGTINQKNEIEIDTCLCSKKLERELSEHLLEEKSESDSTDGAFGFIENLTNKLQTGFDETIGGDSEKKQFIRSLTRIFAMLLNTKVDSVDKLKKIIKIAINTVVKLWSEQN